MFFCPRRLFCHGSNSKTIEKLSRRSRQSLGTGPYPLPLRSIMKKLENPRRKYEVRKKAKKIVIRGVTRLPTPSSRDTWRHCSTSQAPATFPMIHLNRRDKDFLDDQKGPEENGENGKKSLRKHERLAAERRRKEKELAEDFGEGRDD
ncbi:hypothetical protein GWK47_050099 [Chionoecetes opilio]|uniref:Uncharacterized protein n=1 Tax=Chionoecetes opilio TaxID=41210 RepID=A0A8J4Y2X9_CHIOP|nr:hypothetical protein GWK47_050099 [Chionoecetes opilio]